MGTKKSLIVALLAAAGSMAGQGFFPIAFGSRHFTPGARETVCFDPADVTPEFIEIVSVGSDRTAYKLKRLPDLFPPFPEYRTCGSLREVEFLVPLDAPRGWYVPNLPPNVFLPEFGSQLVRSPPLDRIYSATPAGHLNSGAIAYAQQMARAGGPVRRNLLTDSARPGDRITLWGTGIQTLEGLEVDGNDDVFASLEHLSNGLDRIEFLLPSPFDLIVTSP